MEVDSGADEVGSKSGSEHLCVLYHLSEGGPSHEGKQGDYTRIAGVYTKAPQPGGHREDEESQYQGIGHRVVVVVARISRRLPSDRVNEILEERFGKWV